MGKAFTQGCCVCVTLPLLRFVRICRLRSAGRAVYRDGPTKNCSVDGRGSESMCTFSRIHCRMPFTTLPDVMPFTNPPGRRVNLQLLTLLASHLLPRPSSSSFRSARPAADRFDRRPNRGRRSGLGGGDFRAALLRTIGAPIRSDHRRATVVARR